MADALYLIASLPNLDIQSAPDDIYNTIDGFYEDCQVLDEKSASLVVGAVKDPRASKLEIAKQWVQYAFSIKNEIAKKRWASRKSGTYVSVLVNDEVPVSAEALDIVNYVNQESSPLLREQYILKNQWSILEALEAQYQFTLENIIIYGWKLQLYYSYRSLTEERGKTQWNTLVHTLADKSGFSISAITGGF